MPKKKIINAEIKGPRLLLLTPPFTQLNTPYPATAYLTGYLQSKSDTVFQADLGIETFLTLFSGPGLARLFEAIDFSNRRNPTADMNMLGVKHAGGHKHAGGQVLQSHIALSARFNRRRAVPPKSWCPVLRSGIPLNRVAR